MQQLLYTLEQAAEMLQLSKNTIYDLIGRGELIAKKIGKVYRIPARSLSIAIYGLDYDLYEAEQVDLAQISRVRKEIKKARKAL